MTLAGSVNEPEFVVVASPLNVPKIKVTQSASQRLSCRFTIDSTSCTQIGATNLRLVPLIHVNDIY
jgi:hypothetical protein